ncbi:MAG: prephenate dehydratase [Alphaproteobacteria bacterium]|nr:prephenate dehydratase [Alphaproteobacteria bacterium]
MASNNPDNTIAFQGVPGAYSHLACRQAYPAMAVMPCQAFEDVFDVVTQGRARLAMIPVENTVAGRVADIHRLMPESGLFIVAEQFLRVSHCLLGVHGAKLGDLKVVRSHVHALGQCRNLVRELGLTAEVHADTAGAAQDVAAHKDKGVAAIASELAAEIYGLDILRRDVEDASHNTTRFVVMARQALRPAVGSGPAITTFVFQVRNVPAALYKAMGGFATNGVNMTKLESYQLGGSFTATQFYADIEGHPDEKNVSLALEELHFFTSKLKILGVYPAHPFRGLAWDQVGASTAHQRSS